MCGIAGVITPVWSDAQGPALDRAIARLTHRGPDDDGRVTMPAPPVEGRSCVALANRRLAILDLSASGHQPMTSADGRWALVINGEIYNYLELRRELEQLGRQFRSSGDTEVLVEALATWGPDVLGRLQGMFAFAAYDRARGRVILARDPFGIKPLYYAVIGQTLVFASEVPAMLEFPGVSRRIDPRHWYAFLTESKTDYGNGTLFADVHQVPAAHYVEVPLANPPGRQELRYWSLDLTREIACSFDEAADRVRDAFLASMRLHLRSDAPLGFALSGGIDSSAVVMAARTLLGPSHDLRTFSYVPDDPQIDEERHADMVSAAAGAAVHKVRLSAADLRADLETLSSVQGEPFASPVIYAQYRVMRLARDAGVKVLLGGQGADEILAGYDRYLPARIASLLRQGRWVQASRLLERSVTPYPGGTRAALRMALFRALPGRVAGQALRLLRPARRGLPWIDHAWFADRSVEPAPLWSARGPHVMREMLCDNLVESQIQALMRYEDRNAMAFSIENRVPFLSVPLVELLFSLPEAHLLAADGTRKAVFRRAMRGLVPDVILDRRDKIGFSVPILPWFEALRPWIGDRLELAARLPGLVGPQVEARRLMLKAGRPAGDPFLIWRWVSLATWVECFGADVD
jgi:asparagine synthase (glutamine-hydrolysing)